MQRVKWTFIKACASAQQRISAAAVYISHDARLTLPDNIHHIDRYLNHFRFHTFTSSFISSATEAFHGNLARFSCMYTHAQWGIRNGEEIRSVAPCSATPALAARSSFAQTKFTLPLFPFKLPITPSECCLCFRCHTVRAFVRVVHILEMKAKNGKSQRKNYAR